VTREEHLAWAKARALEYVDAGDCVNAMGSLISDLGKHEELSQHPAIQLGGMLLMGGHLKSTHEYRDFIVGCN
jgi:hypothetical protein